MLPSILRTVFVLSALVQVTHAVAQSHATAQAGGLEVSVVDLNSSDGVDATVTFYGADLVVIPRLWNGNLQSDQQQTLNFKAPWAAFSAEFSGSHGQATVIAQGATSFLDATKISANASVNRPVFSGDLLTLNIAEASATGAIPFLLSPYSEVQFSLVVTLSASTAGGYLNEASNADFAESKASIYYHPGIGDNVSALARITASGIATSPGSGLASFVGGEDGRSIVLHSSVVNNSSEVLDTAVFFGLQTQGWTYVSAVPEPGQFVLWGLGLLGIATAARRRPLGNR